MSIRGATTTTFVLLACLQIALGELVYPMNTTDKTPDPPTRSPTTIINVLPPIRSPTTNINFFPPIISPKTNTNFLPPFTSPKTNINVLPPIRSPTPTWKKNCFSETESSNDCSANTIKIFSQYYTCDLTIETDNIPEEIAYLHGTILVAVDNEIFFVRNEQLEPVVEKMSIPPSWNDFTDYNDNRFYVNNKGILITNNMARSDIEIVTTGEFTKRIFLDADLNELLILSYNSGDSAGSLFSLNTDSLNSAEDNMIKATKIEKIGEDISAFAVESGTAKLLLGLRTEKGGGKIIRLSRQEGNPCAEFDVGKRAIMHVIEETKDKISEMLEEILIEKPLPNRTLLQINEMELERKNKELNKQVLILRSQLEAFKRPVGPFPPPVFPSSETTLIQQHEDWSNIIPYEVTRGRFTFQCIIMNDFETVKTKFIEQEKAILELRQQLANANSFIRSPHQMHSRYSMRRTSQHPEEW